MKLSKNLKSQFSMPLKSLNDASNESFFRKSYSFNSKYLETKEYDLILDDNGCREDILFGKRKYKK